MSKDRRLGRGLAALLGENEPVSVNAQSAGFTAPPDNNSPAGPDLGAAERARELADTVEDGQVLLLGVDQIQDNPFQPRRDFSESEIASLAESLKEHDMLQPVLVRRVEGNWQLISGERRLRAAILAGWKKVPARVRSADDRLVAELAIVENLQRKDLNPVEKALSFRRYLNEHQCTQEDLARRIKIDRSTIANLMRLLELPEAIQSDLQNGAISTGHAKALLPLGDEQLQLDYSQQIQREGLSVRAIESLVQERIELEDGDQLGQQTRKARRKRRERSSHVASLEQRLRIALGTKVDIRESARGRGQVVVHFKSPEEFERIESLLLGGQPSGLGELRAG